MCQLVALSVFDIAQQRARRRHSLVETITAESSQILSAKMSGQFMGGRFKLKFPRRQFAARFCGDGISDTGSLCNQHLCGLQAGQFSAQSSAIRHLEHFKMSSAEFHIGDTNSGNTHVNRQN